MSFLHLIFDELEKVASDERLPEQLRQQIVNLACQRARSFSKVARSLGMEPDELADKLIRAYARNTKSIIERYSVKSAGTGGILGGIGALTILKYILNHIKSLLKSPAVLAESAAQSDLSDDLSNVVELELQAKQLEELAEDLKGKKSIKRQE